MKPKSSKSEKIVGRILQTMNIKNFQHQYTPPGLSKLSYDFYFEYGDHKYILEYDGAQHFKRGKYARSLKKFNGIQERDRIKTWYALTQGYYLIRLDFTCTRNDIYLIEMIKISLESKSAFFVSDFHLYRDHILSQVNETLLFKYLTSFD